MQENRSGVEHLLWLAVAVALGLFALALDSGGFRWWHPLAAAPIGVLVIFAFFRGGWLEHEFWASPVGRAITENKQSLVYALLVYGVGLAGLWFFTEKFLWWYLIAAVPAGLLWLLIISIFS